MSAQPCGSDGSARIPGTVGELNELVDSLVAGGAFGVPPEEARRVETHISVVVLAGGYAYKFKKPVNLGFVDFSTLDKRHRYCREELRLNRRTAPHLYLDVVAVRPSREGLGFAGPEPPVEFAVRMRRFPDADGLDVLLSNDAVSAREIETFADNLVRFHRASDQIDGRDHVGDVEGPALQNFTALHAELAPDEHRIRDVLEAIESWTVMRLDALQDWFDSRARDGYVRDGHGDLHLANVVRFEGDLVPFDCIDFDPALRQLDVLNDLAFLYMDLVRVGRDDLAQMLLNRYLERDGGFEGMAGFRLFLSYRALVRAKVAALSARRSLAHEYISLADRLRCAGGSPAMLLTVGLSGSGKSTLAREVLRIPDVVRVRSDVERKRLHGLGWEARSGSEVGGGLYSPEVNRAVGLRLEGLAGSLLADGYHPLVDATLLSQSERARFIDVAREHGSRVVILHTHAPEAVLVERMRIRRRDASEATAAVLPGQQRRYEPPTGRRGVEVIDVPTDEEGSLAKACACVERILRQ